MVEATLNIATHFIPLERLAIALLPVAAVLVIFSVWKLSTRTALLAIGRMLLQLMLLGYVLLYIFQTKTPIVVLLTLAVMLVAASWISLRISVGQRRKLMPVVLLSVLAGGGVTLLVVTQFVLQLDPWFSPRYVIPLGGMIFSNCMNSISLAVERFQSELDRGESATASRNTAFEAALIPITNSLFAVGLVSIPGMMTGQVLAGNSPQIAARYQIMVMCMMFASSGLSAALCLYLMSRDDSSYAANTDDQPGKGR